ncbi:MAG: GNAT family N-acetyltransferase [Firmicutes bacterium]|nr:GNAT family N-acetyltransferase [Bacillota bacterium]
MEIEKARLDDTDELVELRLAYLEEDNGSLDFDMARKIRETLPDYYRSKLNKELFVYLIREDNVIVSCAFLLIVQKPMSPSFPNGKTGVVLNVYTRPSFRRKGYARKIMDGLIQDAERMQLSVIDLLATEDGYPLYQKVGFKDDEAKYHPMKWRPSGSH